jgi:Bacterial Ig domain
MRTCEITGIPPPCVQFFPYPASKLYRDSPITASANHFRTSNFAAIFFPEKSGFFSRPAPPLSQNQALSPTTYDTIFLTDRHFCSREEIFFGKSAHSFLIFVSPNPLFYVKTFFSPAGTGTPLSFSRFFSFASLLFWLAFGLPQRTMAQTVFTENFSSSSSWQSSPEGIWEVNASSAGSSNMHYFSSQAGPVSNTQTNYFAFLRDPSSLTLLPNVVYRISVTCSLASNPATKKLILGLAPVPSSNGSQGNSTATLRTEALTVLETPALQTNGWQTFQQTFTTANWNGNLNRILVLYTPVLGSPVNGQVWVDDILLEQIPNQFPDVPLLTAPSLNQLVNSPVSISATATDPDGNLAGVRFYADGQLLGQDLTAPYTFSANLSPGSHSLSLQAFDDLGLVTNSSSRTIVVNSPPTAQSISPANGAFFQQWCWKPLPPTPTRTWKRWSFT